jgi:hypothetical protein
MIYVVPAQTRIRWGDMSTKSEADIEPLLVPIWPDAGVALGYKTRTAAYAAAARGDIVTVPLGKKLRRVPKRWIDRKTSGDAA